MMYKRSYKFKDNKTVASFLNKTKALIRLWPEPYNTITVWTKSNAVKTKWDKIAKTIKGKCLTKWEECDKKG